MNITSVTGSLPNPHCLSPTPILNDYYCFLPAVERWLAGHRFFLPFFLRSFSTLRPVGLAMRVRKPEVRRRALQTADTTPRWTYKLGSTQGMHICHIAVNLAMWCCQQTGTCCATRASVPAVCTMHPPQCKCETRFPNKTLLKAAASIVQNARCWVQQHPTNMTV